MTKKKWCPVRGKTKYFSEEWALIGKVQIEAKYNSNLRAYKCPCGWWHLYDRSKARQKDNERESRNARRRRNKQNRK